MSSGVVYIYNKRGTFLSIKSLRIPLVALFSIFFARMIFSLVSTDHDTVLSKQCGFSTTDEELDAITDFDPETFDIQKSITHFRCYIENHSREYKSGDRKKGIITSAGSDESLVNAFVNFYTMRYELGVTLPMIIMYWGEQDSDRPSDSIKKFMIDHIEGLEFLDLSAVQYPKHHIELQKGESFNGWVTKSFALYAAPFDKVLFLDSDNLPLQNPTFLFDSKQFLETGNLFWPDLYCGNSALQQNLGMPDDKSRQTESGQILFDKAMHSDVLEWVLWLNSRFKYVYNIDYGDKDTYKSAFFLSGKLHLFSKIQYGLGLALSASLQKGSSNIERLNLEGFIQFDEIGEILFLHRISSHKYNVHGVEKAFPSHIATPSCHYFQKKGWNPEFLPLEHVEVVINQTSCTRLSEKNIHSSIVGCAGYSSQAADGSTRLPLAQIPPSWSIHEILQSANVAFKIFRKEY